jgi:oxidase EvaA
VLSAVSSNDVHLSSPAIRPDAEFDIYASRSANYSLHNDTFVDTWISHNREIATQHSMLIPLKDLDGWQIDHTNGNLSHRSGKFFSLYGIHVRHRNGFQEIEWDQPIIEQPEIGILGILTKKINGILHFCLQAKEEPGNIDSVQLSPTIQATYSNYTKAHGGSSPLFLEYFIEPPPQQIIFARLQTEDGGRFRYKSNRNMVVLVDDSFPIELPSGFIWLTLRQISQLMARDNLVNACVRSIVSNFAFSGIGLFGSLRKITLKNLISTGEWQQLFVEQLLDTTKAQLQPDCGSKRDIVTTLQWLDDCKSLNHMKSCQIGLTDLKEWHFDAKGFYSHKEGRFFRIVGLRVNSDNREVRTWCQPILENPVSGVIGLLIRNGQNGKELLMQAKAEVGNRNCVQVGPTVQFTKGNYEGSHKIAKPYLYDEFLQPENFPIIHESFQSEEGARFYRECHLHRILQLPDGVELQVPRDYRWLPLEHIVFLAHSGEQVNSCARSILSCML